MREMDIDVEKMPLGKLSKKQLENAYVVLGELQKAFANDALSASDKKTAIIGGTTKFYTLLPHNFGLRPMPLISSTEKLVEKIRLVLSTPPSLGTLPTHNSLTSPPPPP